MKIPKSIYTNGLNALVDVWFRGVGPDDPKASGRAVLVEHLSVAEALMIAPSVTFRIYGENVVLPLLTKAFGPKNMELFLEEGAITFHLWFPSIGTHNAEEAIQAGVSPLVRFVGPTDPEHSDPEVSAEKGLTIWGKEQLLSPGTQRRLIRLAADHTRLPNAGLSEYAFNRVSIAYECGELATLGFDADVPMSALSVTQREQLAVLGNQIATTADLMDNGTDLYQSPELWRTLQDLFLRLLGRDKTRAITEDILALHHLPSIPDLLLTGAIAFDDIPRLRKLRATEEYRAWLWGQRDPTNATAVQQAYVAALSPTASVKDSRWYRAASLSTMVGVSACLGIATGPLGALAGGVASAVAGTAIESLKDRIADRLLTKPDPRRFATDVVGGTVAEFEHKRG